MASLIDLLAIFANDDDYRFALHLEVKSPHDKLGNDQARDYSRRADCWKGRERAPKTVLPHDDASTMIACEQHFLVTNSAEVSLFESIVTFEEISTWLSPYPDPS